MYLLLSIIFSTFVVISSDNPLAHGWGEEIEWVPYSEALKVSQATHRPIMLIFHKPWCGACKNLKGQFSSSRDIGEMSRAFVMVNVEDDSEANDPKFSPDGSYIPRIFFMDSTGTVHHDIVNEFGNPQYKYFYSDTTSIQTVMNKALQIIISKVVSNNDEL